MLLPGQRGPELADILSEHVQGLGPLSHDKSRVVRDILECRTPVLGGHLYECDDCARRVSHWNSCLNRHCSGCGGMGQAAWVKARSRDVLPVRYIHIIVTVSDCMHPFFRAAPKVAYCLLLRAAAESLLELCRARLGFTPAIMCVLHTWSQTLGFHPHIHSIVSMGGLSLDQERWISTRKDFFLPQPVVRETFRLFMKSHSDDRFVQHCASQRDQTPFATLILGYWRLLLLVSVSIVPDTIPH